MLGLVGLFNRIVDPYWYYRDVEITGFNAIKHRFTGFERIVKPALVIREQPEAIILGSSYSEIGLNPTNPFFTNHGQLKSMNFSLARASWDMVLCDFEFAVKHTHIKRALIGFHPGSYPAVDCKKDYSSLGQVSTIDMLFSGTAFYASVATLKRQRAIDNTHTREGMFFFNRGDPAVRDRFRDDLPRLTIVPCLNPTDKPLENLDTKKPLDLSGLERMIDLAKEHGVELVFYAYPRHIYNQELDWQCGQQNIRWQALKKIADLIDSKSAQGAKVSAWQFYGYNDITGEPISATQKYWQDPAHFNFEVGDMMMADMFGNTHDKPTLGMPLTSKLVEAGYKRFVQSRAEYLQHHPEFQPDLQKLISDKKTPKDS